MDNWGLQIQKKQNVAKGKKGTTKIREHRLSGGPMRNLIFANVYLPRDRAIARNRKPEKKSKQNNKAQHLNSACNSLTRLHKTFDSEQICTIYLAFDKHIKNVLVHDDNEIARDCSMTTISNKRVIC